LLVALSWYGVVVARAGLSGAIAGARWAADVVLSTTAGEKIPGVLVAHGFAGSLMLGYAHVLAHAGYAVMLWDFGGHGANAAQRSVFTTAKP